MLSATVKETITTNFGAKVSRGANAAMKEAANRGFSTSNEVLLRRGDQHGLTTFPVAQSGSPPQWTGTAWEYTFTHEAAVLFDTGADPHKIEGDPLAFDWEEMEGVQFGDTGQTFDEVYADSWPTVFLPEVDHPGMPALEYGRGGRDAAQDWLNQNGLGGHIDAELR